MPRAPRAARAPCAPCVALYACALLAAAAATVLHQEPLPPFIRTNQVNQEFTINVNGGKLVVSFANGDFLLVKCWNATLDGALRRIEPGTRVAKAKLECAPPRDGDGDVGGGYAAVLRRLGVELVSAGRLELALPPAGPPLTAAHLAGLSLARLALKASDFRRAPPTPSPGTLRGTALASLASLEVRGVTLPPGELNEPPPGLRALVLADAGVRHVPSEALARLTTLGAGDAQLEGGSATLQTLSLTLGGGRTPPNWALFPALATLALSSWSEEAPARWASCGALRSLSLTRTGFTTLPDGWLAACPGLDALTLQAARGLRELPAGLLTGPCAVTEGAAPAPAACPKLALTRLELRLGELRSLPSTLFDPVPNLLHLDLSRNKLLTLPGGIFTKPIKLETLNLSRNRFADNSVYLELSALRHLSELDLSFNANLSDACTGDAEGRFSSGDSHLPTNLTQLILSHTGVTRICSDWRLRMARLWRLDLHFTSITRLSFSDLQYVRDNATSHRSPAPRVELYGANVSTVEYSAREAAAARAVTSPAPVEVRLSQPLACDCRMYRAVRALREHPAHASLAGALLCEGDGKRALATVPLDELLCEDAQLTARLPPACAARVREQGELAEQDDARRMRWRVQVNCERGNLTAMPKLPLLDGVIEWDLRLAGNDIATLDEVPSGLLKLDLRNNSLRNATAVAAAALGGASLVLLAGNPLECECSATALLDAVAALRARGAPLQAEDGAPRCGDGRALLDVAATAREACPAPGAPTTPTRGAALLGALGAALGALALGALAAGSALARPAVRARLKGVLLAWGWLPRGEEPEDESRRFDAFVSFAHEDAAFARELTVRLESGPAPLRLCVHSRDWAPGEHIAAQVAASVRAARRTVALASRHYARSAWARAEFREAAAQGAREGTPRLVLVLLGDEAALRRDAELRRYMDENTYLRADHPHFWSKLREALPKPRPPRATPAPPTLEVEVCPTPPPPESPPLAIRGADARLETRRAFWRSLWPLRLSGPKDGDIEASKCG